ncbi:MULTISPECIES: DUF4083 family protein [Paenibacillus]|uniref:DUF4083 domain-containing protein n=1 Tax=Paenibacillus lautus TaxID=1401 RepID=A0A1R1ATS2_PAELA|nr:DUF4083 family protein [Paenibacillus lautus]OME88974.1 hypothetical protein BK123_28910 [Paenibacillus lautus]
MDLFWMAALSQIFIILLVILFFVGLFRFVNRLILHTKNTKESLRRIEDKIDRLNQELNKTNE